MKRIRNYFTILSIFTVLSIAFFALGGCTPNQKPIPDRTPAPAPSQPAPNSRVTPTPLSPGTVNPNAAAPGNQARAEATADDIARKCADVPGVNKAYVVVVGNVALIGTDIKENVPDNQIEKIREQVATKAKEDKRIVNAVVESDPNAVTRIQNIARGISEGRPISEFFAQINEFFTRVKPTT